MEASRVVKLSSALVAALAACLLGASGALGATFNVNSQTDAVAGGSVDCTNSGATCTLRAAIQAANAAGGANTINIPAGAFKIAIPPAGKDDETTGDFNITNGAVTIRGQGYVKTEIDGNHLDRVFNVETGATASISGVTIDNGRPGGLGNVNSCPSTPIANATGGGILTAGALTLSDDQIGGNMSSGNGGGVDVTGDSPVQLNHVIVTGNTACPASGAAPESLGAGGGLGTLGATDVFISRSSFTGNEAFVGGAVSQPAGNRTTAISQTTLTGNTAESGGAVDEESGLVQLGFDAIMGNTATNNGGGVYTTGFGTNASIYNTTITGNSARGGGGLATGAGTAYVHFSTVTDNTATGVDGGNLHNGDIGTYVLDNAIVAGGHGPSGPSNCAGGPFTSDGHNLFDDDGTNCGAVGTDLTNTDPKLGSLTDNGGPTFTQALLPGSPAIDAASDQACATETGGVDQRGAPRPQGSHCDIGAYEAGTADLSLTAWASPTSTAIGKQVTFTDKIANSGPTFATGVTFNDPAARFKVDSVTTSQGTCSHTSTTVQCAIGTMAKDASVTVKTVATATSAGTLSLKSSVGMDQTDATPSDNTRTVTVTVTAPPPPKSRCPAVSGSIAGTHLGPLALGMTLARAKQILPKSAQIGFGYVNFCLRPFPGIRVAVPSAKLLGSLGSFDRNRVRGRIVIALTANRFYALSGIRPGQSVAAAARRLRLGKPIAIGTNTWYVARFAAANGVLKVRHGVIAEIGIADKRLSSGSRKQQFKFLGSFVAAM